MQQLPSGKYIVAVSGGVDSVVMLHMLVQRADHELIVAHFDHGIRPDSADDALWARELAKRYGLAFEAKREELGPGASEELARSRRYAFLREVVRKHQALIVTAHHADDVIETIAINLTRGTGWRGLAVLDSDIVRPLLGMTKREIKEYALTHRLSWREDSTNQSDIYLRNRIRSRTTELSDDTKQQLLALWSAQKYLKQQIENELKTVTPDVPDYSRHFFIQLNETVAIECLRHLSRGRLTRPQLVRCLIAIKTAKPQTTYQAGSGVQIRFTTGQFEVEMIK